MTHNFQPVFFVLYGIVASSAAQIILKCSSFYYPINLKVTSLLLVSIFIYFTAFGSYYFALRHYEISRISPMMTVSTLSIVTIFGYLIGENFNYQKIFGILLAIISIIFITKS